MNFKIHKINYKHSSKFSLNNISLTFKNNITAIIGPNGSGKSTLIKCIVNIYKCDGEMYYDGESLKRKKEFIKEKIGYLPQTYQNDASITVFEAVLLGLMNTLTLKISKNQEQKVNDILDTFELQHLAKSKINELSGGQLQMVLLAQSIIKEPEILIIVDYAFIQKSSVKKLIEVGLPVVFIDSDGSNPKNDSLYSMLDSMSMLGDMLGYKEKTDKMVKYSRNKIDNVLKITSKAIKENSKKPSVYFELGNVTPQEIGATRGDTSGGLGALLKRLGAVNIGEGHGMDALNPEVVLNSNPDMIMIGGANWNPTSNIMRFGYFITEEQSKKHLEEYTKRPGWSDLSAIKNGRLYGFHFNYAKYPFDFAMIEYIAKQLWPEQFKDVDPEADLKQFFSEYMPIKYSGVFFEDWKDN